MSLEITLYAADGTVWDLRNGKVRLTEDGIDGLLLTASRDSSSETSGADGEVLLGSRSLGRKILLEVELHADTELDWHSLHEEWTNLWEPRVYNRLMITNPRSTTRSIDVRVISEKPNLSRDPAEVMTSVLRYELRADFPHWRGDPVRQEFAPAEDDGRDFYGAPGVFGPPFYLKPETTGAVTVANRGRMTAWPIWTFYGPTPSFSALVAGRLISSEAPLLLDEWVRIDTRPNKKSALREDGRNVTNTLSSRQFAPIPQGSAVPVEVVIFGSGRATLEFDQLFYKGY